MSDEKNVIKLPIRRTFRDDIITHYTNDLLVQHQGDSFILSFFEIWNPAVIGETQQEREDSIKGIEVVDAKCVARLAVSPDVMKKIVNAMNMNFKKYEESLGKKING